MGILLRLGDRSSSVHEEISKVIRGQFLFMSIDLVINYELTYLLVMNKKYNHRPIKSWIS
jgi:hypothetical protein